MRNYETSEFSELWDRHRHIQGGYLTQTTSSHSQKVTIVIEKKVTATTLVAALVTIAVWALRTFSDVEIPAEVAAAITTVIVGLAGYIAPHTPRIFGEAAAEPPATDTTAT